MNHFARVIDGVVDSVIVAEQDFIDTLPDKGLWVQTYQTATDNPKVHYAGIGFNYDTENGVFYPPKPNQEATLDQTTWTWFWNEIPTTSFMDGNQ